MRRFLAYTYIIIIVCVLIVVVDVVVVVVGVVVFVAVVVVVFASVVVVGLLCVASRLISNSPRFTSCLWVTKLKILSPYRVHHIFGFFLSLFRRLFSIMSYFFFLYNIILGLFSAFMRILKGMLLGVIFISRIDRTSLMQGFQA